MAASVPHPHGLFSGRRAAQLGATWASLHRDEAPGIHLRSVLLLVGLSLGSAAAALLVAHLLTVGVSHHAGAGPVDALAAEAALNPGPQKSSSPIPPPLTSLQAALQERLPASLSATAPTGISAHALEQPDAGAAALRAVAPNAGPAIVPASPAGDPLGPPDAAGAALPPSSPVVQPEPTREPSALREAGQDPAGASMNASPATQARMPAALTMTPLAVAAPMTPEAPPATVTVLAKVTGYCPCALCCGALAEGVTSINRNVYRHPRGIAVDPRLLAYRSFLSVPGYGTAMVDDTGSAMRCDGDHGVIHLDVRFKTHEEALRWGVRWLPIEVPVASQAARLPAADETPAQ